MKNTYYSYSSLYKMIRTLYLLKFPHKVIFLSHEAASLYIESQGIVGDVRRRGDTYAFHLTKVTPCTNSTFLGENDMKIAEEKFLAKTENFSDLLLDLEEMHHWMESEGFFTKHGRASEKLIAQSRL